ncbi:thioredoxin domain-containing protein [Romboutsia timonensis]|uniref:thioredoxin domain-containing protein n=1 Tax=Romboutsia timonensis TaxID=1776391 RepID=UPI0008DAEB16|nr:thioredoxin domain-containing protein [Romboutsia timonensis]
MKKNKILIITYILALSIISSGCNFIKVNEGILYGNEDSPIEIINYTSFQCSACTTLHEELGESIKKYIDSGQIKYIEKQIDIKRFEYDDVIYKHMNEEQISDFEKLSEIYEKQDKWIVLKSPEEVIEFLNLEQEENKKHVKDLKKINKEKDKLEIKAVPTMFINGERIEGNIPKEEFENKIESLLNKK